VIGVRALTLLGKGGIVVHYVLFTLLVILGTPPWGNPGNLQFPRSHLCFLGYLHFYEVPRRGIPNWEPTNPGHNALYDCFNARNGQHPTPVTGMTQVLNRMVFNARGGSSATAWVWPGRVERGSAQSEVEGQEEWERVWKRKEMIGQVP